MPGRTRIVECCNPHADHWRIGPLPPPQGHLSLLGWRLDPDPVDAGVHPPVDRILAQALSDCARITFLWSDGPGTAPDGDGNVVYSTGGTSGMERAIAWFKGQPSAVTLLSTRDAETAKRMFDRPRFGWSEQGQIALLSDAEQPPPKLDREAVVDLTSDAWTARCLQLSADTVLGAVRPGVDGDVAGLFSVNSEFQRTVLEALRKSCSDTGAIWISTEDDQAFAEQLKTGESG